MDSKFVSPTHVCAVDIGGTKIACGIVTLNGSNAPKVQSVKKVPTNAKEGGKQVLATVLQALIAPVVELLTLSLFPQVLALSASMSASAAPTRLKTVLLLMAQ